MPDGAPRAQNFSNIIAIIETDLFKRYLAEHIGAPQPVLKRQNAKTPDLRIWISSDSPKTS